MESYNRATIAIAICCMLAFVAFVGSIASYNILAIEREIEQTRSNNAAEYERQAACLDTGGSIVGTGCIHVRCAP